MNDSDDAFLKRLMETFRGEAEEHLDAISSGLLMLEREPGGPDQAGIIEEVFREAHSLKGAARAVNLTGVEAVCQAMENVLGALKAGKRIATPALFDLLDQAVRGLAAAISTTAQSANTHPEFQGLVDRLKDAAQGGLGPEAPQADDGRRPSDAGPAAVPPEAARSRATAPEAGIAVASGPADTVRVATLKLDRVMRQTEELLGPRLAGAQRNLELREINSALDRQKKQRTRVHTLLRSMDRVLVGETHGAYGELRAQDYGRLREYLEEEQLFFDELAERLARLQRSSAREHRALSAMVGELLHDVKELYMLPFASLVESFPRFVRDLAREQGKAVDVVCQGGDIEIDRRILDALRAPLIHLLRNSVDHGIEKPEVRAAAGKPERGTITVAISQMDSGKVEVRLEDDGAGIDAESLKAAACKSGALSEEEVGDLSSQEVLALAFRSGVSTSPMITDISGRGLGLAILREKVEELGGSVSIDSDPGRGTAFRMLLPLTLATFRGVLVRAEDQLAMIPSIHVERVMPVAPEDIATVENRETLVVGDTVLSLARLADVLELARKPPVKGQAQQSSQAVVLGLGGEQIAFMVDQVLGEQEVLAKPLGPQLARVRNVGGATVLGTGELVVILNVSDLIKSSMRTSQAGRSQAPAGGEPQELQAHSVLVVEDSITSRALLKNILESAGYGVTTAVDGLDAYTTLKTGTYDLVVSDVEMPRMNGFELTAKIRSDHQLAALPVVLVTALESREHRERGVDVGANAYIVKSSFEQSNLLEVVARLL